MRPSKHGMGLILAGALVGVCSGEVCAAEYTIIDLGVVRDDRYQNLPNQPQAMKQPKGIQRGPAIDLGTLSGSTGGFGINDSGQVTGYSYVDQSTAPRYHAFVYSHGTMTDIGTLGGDWSYGNGINNAGEVTGASGRESSFHAFIYSRGSMIDLGTLGGDLSEGRAINNAGQVAGYSSLPGNQAVHAFVYSRGEMTDLGTLDGGHDCRANAINNAGQVTGYSYTGNVYHAFLYSHGEMTDLGTLDGGDYSTSIGYSINAAGQVVGESAAVTSHSHAFLYSDGHMQDLGTLGGSWSLALRINNKGLIVGTSYDDQQQQRAFLYSSGLMTDLNTLLPSDSPWDNLSQATDINESGQITGIGSIKGEIGITHAFLMTPKK